MPIEITMPRLSDTMEAGTVIKWSVKEGDEISAGDAVADVETDKATMEMQAYDDGTVAKIMVKEGEQVPVGTVIALLAGEDEDAEEVRSNAATKKGESKKKKADDDGEESDAKESATAVAERDDENQDDDGTAAEDSAEAGDHDDSDDYESRAKRAHVEKEEADADDEDEDAEAGAKKAARKDDKEADRRAAERKDDTARSGVKSAAAATENGAGRLFISPVARRMADEHGVDVKSISGTGPNGRIIKRDIQEAIERGTTKPTAAPKPAPRAAEPAVEFEPGDKPLSNMRQTIAKRLVESYTTIPHYQVTAAFNMDPLLDLRGTLNEQLESQGVKLSVNDFLVRACALAIHRHPEFNAVWGGDKVTVKDDVNVAVAVSLPRERGGGLVVAVIRNADQKGLRQISEETRTLAEKARTRGLTIEEMSDSTFTISNLGMFGVEHFTAIINPPNSAILAVGAAIKKPVVRDGQIVIGHEMQATLSLDHRIIDGAMAAEYLRTLKQMIEHPATLLV